MKNFQDQLGIREDRLRSVSNWGSRRDCGPEPVLDEMMPEGFMEWMRHPYVDSVVI